MISGDIACIFISSVLLLDPNHREIENLGMSNYGDRFTQVSNSSMLDRFSEHSGDMPITYWLLLLLMFAHPSTVDMTKAAWP